MLREREAVQNKILDLQDDVRYEVKPQKSSHFRKATNVYEKTIPLIAFSRLLLFFLLQSSGWDCGRDKKLSGGGGGKFTVGET